MKTPENPNENVLITGASSGIGLHLAREFAQHGHSLVLIAPVLREIEEVAVQIEREFEVGVQPLAKDLSRDAAPGEIFDALASSGTRIDILVNNAGVGQRGRFWENPPERDIQMLRLNVEAVVRLIRLFLTPMLARGHGRILNTASIAGFEPGPNLAVYHATKAFVLSFSESLATELEGTGVTMTALCPGATDTDFFPKAGMIDTPAFQQANLLAPQSVAAAAYDALINGDRVVVPGTLNKAAVASRRLLPESAQAKKNETLYTDTDPAKRKRAWGELEEKEAAAHRH